MNPDLPICLTCNKPVDKLIVQIDPTNLSKMAIVFCHGQMESGVLSLHDRMSDKISVRCFEPGKGTADIISSLANPESQA